MAKAVSALTEIQTWPQQVLEVDSDWSKHLIQWTKHPLTTYETELDFYLYFLVYCNFPGLWGQVV